MRIIGGRNQRRQIIAPAKLPVRPTTDMAKEALFSIINNHFDFEEISVLDLFAGTGNISYEFASRGAMEVVSVDINNHCTQFIKKTTDELQMPNVRVVRADALHFLGFCKVSYDIVFADPPYDYEPLVQIPAKVFDNGVLKPGGWLILEHGDDKKFASFPHFVESRRYGKVHFSFFRFENS